VCCSFHAAKPTRPGPWGSCVRGEGPCARYAANG
jgi:hypothetical protein